MCGLVGVLTKKRYGFDKKQIEVFSSLLFIDLLRGDDSTGVFVATNRGEVALAKEVGDSLKFIKTKEYGKLCNRALSQGIAMVGHNRKATAGAITDLNAHPFVVDDKIVLVHNGTLWGDHKNLKDVEVDSHAIAHMIHENESVEDAMEKISGAYALIWYEVEKQRLNFLRNSYRPLWWIETEDEYIWCSERNMIDWVVSKFNLKVIQQASELPEDHLNCFSWENNEWEISDRKLNLKSVHNYEKDAPWNYKNHPYACAYSDDDYCIPELGRDNVRALPPPKGFFNPNNNKCFEYETEMAVREDRLMSYSEYYRLKDTFAPTKTIRVKAFDYNYSNVKDMDSGFFLYLSSIEHPNIIFRKWYDKDDINEERLIQIAVGEYSAEASIGGQLEFFHIPSAGKNGVQLGKALCRVDTVKLSNGELIESK